MRIVYRNPSSDHNPVNKAAVDNLITRDYGKMIFCLFVSQSTAREHKGKLALDSLLIMPVQRIPRYELLIQVLFSLKL